MLGEGQTLAHLLPALRGIRTLQELIGVEVLVVVVVKLVEPSKMPDDATCCPSDWYSMLTLTGFCDELIVKEVSKLSGNFLGSKVDKTPRKHQLFERFRYRVSKGALFLFYCRRISSLLLYAMIR